MPEEPIFEASTDEYHNRSDAMIEFVRRLNDDGSLTFAQIDEIAEKYGTMTGTLLVHSELSPDCVIDYTASVVVCR